MAFCERQSIGLYHPEIHRELLELWQNDSICWQCVSLLWSQQEQGSTTTRFGNGWYSGLWFFWLDYYQSCWLDDRNCNRGWSCRYYHSTNCCGNSTGRGGSVLNRKPRNANRSLQALLRRSICQQGASWKQDSVLSLRKGICRGGVTPMLLAQSSDEPNTSPCWH